MPYKKTKITSGKDKGKYRGSTPSGVKAKATTKEKVDAQERLIRAIDHGWKPTNKKPKKKK